MLRLDITGSGAEAIARAIEAAVREERLSSGDSLPTVRGLAEQLGVSPTTVASAYRLLRHRGLIAGAGRRGTRVARRAPLLRRFPVPVATGAINVSDGNPDPTLLPDMKKLLARVHPQPTLYGTACVLPALAEAARQQLAADGIRADTLTVVSGAMDGIERVLTTQLRSGDKVAVEDPGFAGVLDLVTALGLQTVAVEIDDEGMKPKALSAVLARGVHAVIVTPRAQNPTGAAVSARRAAELRKILAAHASVLLIEDDHAAAVSGHALHSLSTRTTRWAYVRSAGKSLGPDLRVAVLAGPEDVVAPVEARHILGIRWVSHILQAIVAEAWTSRSVTAVVAAAEAEYAARRAALIEALARHGVAATGRSGLNVWIPVREEAAPLQALLAAGWSAAAGERFRLHSGPGLRVSIGRLARDRIPALADAVADALGSAPAVAEV
ncbi:MAG TPA: aminotransferase class I/II-fold pyridoxal phosphate-dependent enzyme [Candidatus Limnocylindrales bacterium]|nr:aminotransferase class I/II-fold pyridoxal phosphate-dependent enzyme [Candidatus Limnocylindrales bacterium]